MNNEVDRRIRSLRELPQDWPPPRDLWPRIETQIRAQAPQVRRAARYAVPAWCLSAAAALAVLACSLAAGLWWLHGAGVGHHAAGGAIAVSEHRAASGAQGGVTTVAAQDDAVRRAALLRGLDTRLRSLPAPTQQKVRVDLQVIQQSIQDIQSALGRDPGNALLHEMLRDTEQDEERLAATVREAGEWTQEASVGAGRAGS